MNNPDKKINRIYSKQEQEKLKFSSEDQKIVFSKIQNGSIERKKKASFTIIAASIMMPVLLAVILLSLLQTPLKPHITSALPFLESLLKEHGDEGQKKALKEYEPQQINQSAESNGIKITMNEVFFDGARISASYAIENQNEDKAKDLDFFSYNMKIDGGNAGDIGFSGGKIIEREGNKINKIVNIDIEKELPETFTFELSIDELINTEDMESDTIKGSWSFSFPIKRIGEIYQLEPSIVRKSNLGDFRIRKMTFSPSGMLMDIETKQTQEAIQETGVIAYKVYDDKGKLLTPLNESGSSYKYESGTGTRITSILYSPADSIPKRITVKPYISLRFLKGEPEENIISITEKLPIFLPQGENGGILINEIVEKKGEVWVKYDVKGDFVPERKKNFSLINGKERSKETSVEQEGDRDSAKRKNQLMKFKIPYNENLHFIAIDESPEWIKGWELKILIKKEDLKKLSNSK